MENNITSKRKASSQCPPTLSAGGGGGGEGWKLCNVSNYERPLYGAMA